MPNLGRFGRRRGLYNDNSIQRQYLWNVPEGNRPDFSESYAHGENIPISWNALNNSMYDLWITSWNWDSNPVALCLASEFSKINHEVATFTYTETAGSVNLAHDGSLNLINPNPPSAFFADKSRYVLRFKPPTPQGQYVPLDPEIVSPAFFIVKPEEKGKPTTTATADATSSSSSASSAPSLITAIEDIVASSPSSSQSPNSRMSHGTMSSGAAAGLTIGLVFLVFLVVFLAVGIFYMRRRRAQRQAQQTPTATEKTAIIRPQRRRKRLMTWSRRLRRDMKESRGQAKDEKKRGWFVSLEAKSPTIDGLPAAWANSPELPGDEGWVIHELYGGETRRPGPVELPGHNC